MLEYFTIKKLKKHREAKAADEQKDKQESASETIKKEASPAKVDAPTPSPQIISQPPDDDDNDGGAPIEGTPVLNHEDEEFLKRLTSGDVSIASGDDDETPPPLPPRVKTPVIEIDSDSSSVSSKEAIDKKGKGKAEEDKGEGKGKTKDKKSDNNKSKRFSFVTNLPRSLTTRRKAAGTTSATTTTTTGLEPDASHLAVPPSSSTEAEAEAAAEKKDMARVLDDLDLSARNNRVFSLSAESAETVRRFTQVLKDLVNGVPTAYGDLVGLLEDRDGVLARNFEKLPKSLKKLVAQLPEKLTSSLAPELLAAAAEAQGLAPMAEGSGLKDAAKKFLTPSNLRDLVTKPGALVGMLKGIVNALKTRFPAFVGTNVLWSLAVFLLLSMLWYCYKRGREVRLEREASETAAKEGKTDESTIEGQPRVEELPDDPQLPAASSGKEVVSHDKNE